MGLPLCSILKKNVLMSGFIAFSILFKVEKKFGKPVYTPDRMAEEKSNFDLILIGTDGYRHEIHDLLRKMNYKEFYDIWFYESMLWETEEDVNAPPEESSIKPKAGDTLFAFYDLRVSPVTFDTLTFMVMSEFRRLALKKKKVHFHIIKDSKNDKWNWIIYNVIIPCTQFIPSVSGITISKSDEFIGELIKREDVFPAAYRIDHPVSAYTLKLFIATVCSAGFLPGLHSTAKAREFVRSWSEKKQFVR